MKNKMDLEFAKNQAERIVSLLKPGCQKIEIAGSIRRKKSLIGDIEIVLVPKIEKRSSLSGLRQFLNYPTSDEVNLLEERLKLIKTQENFHFGKDGPKYKELIYPNFKVDLFIADETNFGLIFMIRTGSADYSKNFMIELNKRKQYKVKDGYLWCIAGDTFEKVPVPDEATLYKLVNFPHLDPTERSFQVFN